MRKKSEEEREKEKGGRRKTGEGRGGERTKSNGAEERLIAEEKEEELFRQSTRRSIDGDGRGEEHGPDFTEGYRLLTIILFLSFDTGPYLFSSRTFTRYSIVFLTLFAQLGLFRTIPIGSSQTRPMVCGIPPPPTTSSCSINRPGGILPRAMRRRNCAGERLEGIRRTLR